MTILTLILAFIFGTLIASFVNAWVWRTRTGRKLTLNDRSMCPVCKRTLRPLELIPIISFLYLRGRCSTCDAHIPRDYLWVEVAGGLLAVFLIVVHGFVWADATLLLLLRDSVLLTLLLYIFVYDAKYQEIPTHVTWPVALLLFLVSIAFAWMPMWQMVVGALVGGGFFYFQYVISRGRWIGGGDVRFGVLMGVILGWPVILFALFFAYILGAAVATPLLIMRKKRKEQAISFGPFLVLGTVVAMFWGEQVLRWYVGLIM